MARNITVTFEDGSTHVYQNAPDDATPDAVSQRAAKDFGKTVKSLDGGRAKLPQAAPGVIPSDPSVTGPPVVPERQSFGRDVRNLFTSSAQPAPVDPNPLSPESMRRRVGNQVAGAVRGAGSLGATAWTPIDYVAGNTHSWGNPERRAAMDAALTTMGADVNSPEFRSGKFAAELAGTAAMPVASKGGFLANTGKNALSGGAAAGMVNLEDAGMGAMIGGVASPVLGGVKWAAETGMNSIVNPLMDLVRPSGAKNVLGRYIRTAVGEDNVAATTNAARQAVKPKQGPGLYEVPYKPTVAEVMTNVPEGSPLVRIQELTASTRGGPSAEFGRVAERRTNAINAAEAERDAVTEPMRRAALQAANQAGGVPRASIVHQIDQFKADPQLDSEFIKKTLHGLKQKLLSKTTLPNSGHLDAERLYAFRKWDLGHYIEKVAKDTGASGDKALMKGLESDLRKVLDDAIEQAGGQGWKDYLKEYHIRSKAIDTVKKTAETMYQPTQKTNLGGGLNIADETRTHIPNLLSRTAMASNFALRRLGNKLEPKVDELATEVFKDPRKYAALMKSLPPQYRFHVDNALRAANAAAVYQAE